MTCFLCNKQGHIARDCRERSARLQQSKYKAHTVANVTLTESTVVHNDNCPRSDKNTEPTSEICRACVRDCTPDFCSACVRNCTNLPTFDGYVNDHKVETLRDSGCSVIVVKTALVNQSDFTGNHRMLILIDNSKIRVPTAMCFVKSPFFTGLTEVICIEQPVCELIIGNVEGVHPVQENLITPCSEAHTSHYTTEEEQTTPIDELNVCHVTINRIESPMIQPEEIQTSVVHFTVSITTTVDYGCTVMTRNQLKETQKPLKTLKPLRVPQQVKVAITKEQFHEAQLNDKSLSRFFDRADIYFPDAERNTLTSWYIVDDDLLYRMSKNPAAASPVKQLMVPTALRLKVLTLGHEAAFAGHLGVKKTFDRIAANFHWPGILQSIQRFCASCDICQRTVRKGSVSRAPLHSIPVVGIPFEKVAIDIIGPIVPKSARGHRWILTLIDFATRYPEAVCLKSTETEPVAEALLSIFARMGVPKIIVSSFPL